MNKSKLQPTEVTVLKKIREELGLSQEALAREIDCSLSTVQRTEKGEREPLMYFYQTENLRRLLVKNKIKIPKRLSDKVST